ncbi:MAG: hypothetical protein LBT02_02195 [Rickettsiales bacterium]|jgi:hypothetical protein|nr:hypothetical protein [Rickettsiales bacterium]
MAIFSKYDKYMLPTFILSIESAVKEIKKINSLKLEPFVLKTSMERLNKSLSGFLFKAVDKENFEDIKEILSYKFVSKRDLLDENGRNILEHCVLKSKNKVFMTLFNNHNKLIASYLIGLPEILASAVNAKNYELIEFLLKQMEYREMFKKEQLSNIFFVLIEGHQNEIAKYFAKEFEYIFQIEIIEATMIYFIANNKNQEFDNLFQFDDFIKKIDIKSAEKMIAYSVLNKNTEAIKTMIADKHFMNIVNNGDPNMQKSILGLLNNKNLLS